MKNFSRLLFFFALAGLITACKGPKGEDATTGDKVDAKTVGSDDSQAYAVNPGGTLSWEGKKVIGGGHNGTINIKSGSLELKDGKLVGGTFEIDMASLTDLDMEGEKKGKLEGHLKSADFFDVEKFPVSTFQITGAQALADDPEANHIVAGNLTIKGITKNVAFKANVNITEGGIEVTSPPFVIDRTDWNVQYGSSKFFADLAKDKVLSDKIGLAVKFSASKKVEG